MTPKKPWIFPRRTPCTRGPMTMEPSDSVLLVFFSSFYSQLRPISGQSMWWDQLCGLVKFSLVYRCISDVSGSWSPNSRSVFSTSKMPVSRVQSPKALQFWREDVQSWCRKDYTWGETSKAQMVPVSRMCNSPLGCNVSSLGGHTSKTGRIRFRRVWFQTPNSVSFLPSPSSRETVSSSQPIIGVLKRTRQVFSQNSPSFSQNSPSLPQNAVSSLFRNSTLETVPPFPNTKQVLAGPM